MALFGPKIISCIRNLKNRLNLTVVTNRASSSINGNSNKEDEIDIKHFENVQNIHELPEIQESNILLPIIQSPAQHRMQHDSFAKFIKLRQLQPAYQPEFMQSCIKEEIKFAPSTSTNTARVDHSNIRLPNVGTAIPFKTETQNAEPEIILRHEKSSLKIDNNNHSVMKISTRGFSTKTVDPDETKCKRLNNKKKECKKITMDCDPAVSYSCKDRSRIKPCTKQESPYPSYSESCHEEYEEKPDECKMCPWQPNNHPTFKPPNKKFHTLSIDCCSKRNECPPPPKPKEPCGWVKDEKKPKQKSGGKDDSKKRSMSLSVLDQTNLMRNILHTSQGFSNYLNKSIPHERPVALTLLKAAFGRHTIPKEVASFRLPQSNKIDLEIKTLFSRAVKANEQANNEVSFEKKKPCKKSVRIVSSSLEKNGCFNGYEMAKSDCTKDKCRKFPFPAPKIERTETERPKCKVKKKRKIKDCPDKKDCHTIKIPAYLLMDDDDDKKEKCPKIDLEKCLEEVEEEKCPKSKGITRKCPADLTKKRKKFRPKKKTIANNPSSVEHLYSKTPLHDKIRPF